MLNIETLNNINSYEDFFALSQKLNTCKKEDLFNFLFPTAISKRESSAAGIAGKLLIDLEPKHTRSCQELIGEIANSEWFVSFKEVPFYLVSQFGKWSLKSEIDAFLRDKKDLTQQQRQRAETIWYWASQPSVILSDDLFYFEWQEVIEGGAAEN